MATSIILKFLQTDLNASPSKTKFLQHKTFSVPPFLSHEIQMAHEAQKDPRSSNNEPEAQKVYKTDKLRTAKFKRFKLLMMNIRNCY